MLTPRRPAKSWTWRWTSRTSQLPPRRSARVMTSLPFQVGDVLLLREASRGGFETRAEVRGVTRVQPTVDRLHLRFVDGRAPQRLLRL
jgi:hypothetical protein